MKPIIPVLLIALSGSVGAVDFQSCAFTPKQTEENPYPELEAFQHCASYHDKYLEITDEHWRQLNFDENQLTSLFTHGQYFYIKPDRSYLPVITYDNGADYFQEGLTRSLLNGKIAFYNRDFKLVLAPSFDWAWPFQNGKAKVCNGCVLTQVDAEHTGLTGGTWGYIDKQGNMIEPLN
tara:strand:- start:49 stop:582 length:534 start_codon:yes stop_codon:yes gene_type:complete